VHTDIIRAISPDENAIRYPKEVEEEVETVIISPSSNGDKSRKSCSGGNNLEGGIQECSTKIGEKMCLGDEIGGNNPQETTQVVVQKKKVCVNKDGGKVTMPCVLPPLACRVSSRMRNRGEYVAALGEKISTQQNLEGSDKT